MSMIEMKDLGIDATEPTVIIRAPKSKNPTSLDRLQVDDLDILL